MKKILSTFLLASVIFYSQGQQQKLLPDNLNIPEIKLLSPTTDFSKKMFKNFFKDNNYRREDTLSIKWVDPIDAQDFNGRAIFSHSTRNGYLYLLLSDDMPCLAPDMNKIEKMPVHELPCINIDGMPIMLQNKIIQL